MFGRAAAGSVSIANGINPSIRKTIALSGTKAIVHMPAKEMAAPSTYQPKIGHST
jgi:hypothetical protein